MRRAALWRLAAPLLLVALLPFQSQGAPLPSPSPLADLRARLLAAMLPASGDSHAPAVMAAITSEVPFLLSTQTAAGTWPDVNYTDSSDASAWNASIALQRALMLGVAANVHATAAPCVGALAALNAWLRMRPANANWWWRQLGEVSLGARVLLLCPDAATAARAGAPGGLFSATTLADVAAWPGANRVWGAVAVILASAVVDNATAVDAAFALLHAGYAIAPLGEDGPAADGGFHQHGPLVYQSYGYGAHFLANALTMEAVTAGTRWACSPAEWAVLASVALDGAQWVTRASEFHLGAAGRHNTYFLRTDAFSVVSGHYHFYAAYPLFALAFPSAAPPLDSALAVQYARALAPHFGRPRGEELRAFAAQVLEGGAGVVGHRHFWLSDYTVHARAAASFSLHMSSNRTLSSECVNGEGLQNRAMGDGVLTTHVSGREYTAHVPVWRWTLVPGTTELQGALAYTCANAQLPQSASAAFVGGASDGWLGTAAMQVTRVDGAHALAARKAWAFLDDGAVALGAAIASDGALNIATSLEQRLLAGDVWAARAATPALVPPGTLLEAPDVTWVWHAGVAYALLAPPAPAACAAAIGVSTRTQDGSLADITQGPPAPISLPTFLLYIHHGNASAAHPGAYAYAILPGIAAAADAPAAVAAFAASTRVVANDAGVQAVCRAAPNATLAWALQATFWPAAGASAPAALAAASPCPAVAVDAPAILVVAQSTDARIAVTAAAPLRGQAGSALAVTLAGVHAHGDACAPTTDGSGTVVMLALPTGIAAGSSVAVECAL